MASLYCSFSWLVLGLLLGTLLSWLLHTLLSRASDGGPGTSGSRTGRGGDQGDQLEAVEGIGPKIAGVFREAGIRTFAQLAATTPSELRAILDRAGWKYDLARPDTWPHQGRLLAEGDILGFVELIHRLKAGIEPSGRA